MSKSGMDELLKDIGLDIRMELARIVDPRRDRDPQIVLLEVRQICEVLVRTIERVTKIPLDRDAAAMALSDPAVEEDSQDAANHDTPVAGSAATAAKRKTRRSQVPM